MNELDLVRLALALGCPEAGGPVSVAEVKLLASIKDLPRLPATRVRDVEREIGEGQDPLGELFARARAPEQRRRLGATYTPDAIVSAMVEWAAAEGSPDRVVDPGAGSGRFTIAAAKRFPRADLVAVEIDPLAALLTRANLAVTRAGHRARIVLDDFRSLKPEAIEGRTLWIGNPPYVRHHQIGPDWKAWLTRTAASRNLTASQLAGLHVHFFLATAQVGGLRDFGSYITSSEWLDVNYGSLVRQLLLDGLGGVAVHVLDPKALPFSNAATTGAISCFKFGARPTSMRLRRVERVADLGALEGGHTVKRERLAEAPRWTLLMRNAKPVPEGYVELGELCRVHRGTVTGANGVWVTSAADPRLPERVLVPSVTRAKELFTAVDAMTTTAQLRRVIDLPVDLEALEDPEERKMVDAFLKWARDQRADEGYVATHRKSWWSVRLREPAPILATYMARRPPAFVRNLAGARHINIAHGLYPREPLPDLVLDRLAKALRSSVSVTSGRTYAGGLTKFEPREMERLPVPSPEMLLELS